MLYCTFDLNGKPLTELVCGTKRFPAYSGQKSHINKRSSACLPNEGAIPPGTYYIFDRQSGGLLGPLRDLFSDKGDWFALYAIDNKIDDQTRCDKIKRGQFRLHPEGPLGISKGCITIKSSKDYQTLYSMLKNAKQEEIPGVGLKAYGKVVVK